MGPEDKDLLQKKLEELEQLGKELLILQLEFKEGEKLPGLLNYKANYNPTAIITLKKGNTIQE